ncbi:MAG: hypothetical protein J2P57_21130, partial [Acidimicrobiaceae bacterium]|nr:hypothetical protein [Acidimicrobiaceae bacterium]
MPEVVLTVAGDRASMEVEVDPLAPLAPRIPEWAAACSSHPPGDLVLVSGNARYVFDPAGTPASLGLSYGAVVRLMTGPEATHLRHANAAPAFETPPPAPEPTWAEPMASSAAPQPGPPQSGPPWHAAPPVGADWRQPPPSAGQSYWPPPEQPPWPAPRHAPQQPSPPVPPIPSWQAPSGFEPGPPTSFESRLDEGLPEHVSTGRRFARVVKAVLSRTAVQSPEAGQFAKPVVP